MSDLISRQAAIDAHCELCEDKGFCGDICPDVEVFRLIPTAQPERTGEWIRISPAKIYECSICGKNVMTADIDEYHFCHGCGARMKN